MKEGFSGADPYEIIQRYVIGELDRAQLLDELGRWEYTPEVYGEWEGYFPGDWQNYVEEATAKGSSMTRCTRRLLPDPPAERLAQAESHGRSCPVPHEARG